MKYSLSAIVLFLGITTLTSGCGPTPVASVGSASYAYPQTAASATPSTTTLLSENEKQLYDILTRAPRPSFPAKAGIYIYDKSGSSYSSYSSSYYSSTYTKPLDSDDFKSLTDKFKTNLLNSGLVQKTDILSSTILSYSTNFDEIRKLAARFQEDIVLVVSTKQEIKVDNTQPLGFWDSFVGSKWYRYATANTEVVCFDINTGIYLFTDETVGKSDIALLDKDSVTYQDDQYDLKKQATERAWDDLNSRIIKNLISTKAKIDSMPAPTPAPTATASPGASASPSPSATPSTI